jgi:hypothetical protein
LAPVTAVWAAATPRAHRKFAWGPRAAARFAEEAAQKSRDKTRAEAELARVNADLERVREHLSALGDKGGGAAGANPLVTRILALEDQLTTLRRNLDGLEADRTRQVALLSAELAQLASP